MQHRAARRTSQPLAISRGPRAPVAAKELARRQSLVSRRSDLRPLILEEKSRLLELGLAGTPFPRSRETSARERSRQQSLLIRQLLCLQSLGPDQMFFRHRAAAYIPEQKAQSCRARKQKTKRSP